MNEFPSTPDHVGLKFFRTKGEIDVQSRIEED